MEKNNFKEYYNQTVSKCNKCNPKGFILSGDSYISCECLKEYNRLKQLYTSGLPKSYWDKKFCDFEGDQRAMEVVYDYINNLNENLDRGLGLYFWGDNRIGKTLLASYIHKEVLNKNKQSKFYYYVDILNVFSESWKDEEAKKEIEHDIMESDLLIIDDLGKEFYGKSNFSSSSLDAVLRKRVGNLKSVIITSNLDRFDIKDTYGKAIIDLLKESLREVKVIGDSYRPNKLEENKR